MADHISINGHFSHEVWLRVGVDKASDTTRATISIANVDKCNSAMNFFAAGSQFPLKYFFLSRRISRSGRREVAASTSRSPVRAAEAAEDRPAAG
jgi:hypothetical protein